MVICNCICMPVSDGVCICYSSQISTVFCDDPIAKLATRISHRVSSQKHRNACAIEAND